MEVKEIVARPTAVQTRGLTTEETRRSVLGRLPAGATVDNHARSTGFAPVLHMPTRDGVAGLHGNPFRHILVALDGSEVAERILPVVAPLARAFGSHVTLLRVVPLPQPPMYAGHMDGYSAHLYYGDLVAAAKRARSEATEYLASHEELLVDGGVEVTSRTQEGPAAECIVEYAEAAGADLIAMTTHGRGGLGRLVFGSVAEAVLRSAPVPVLLVRVSDP